MITIEQLAEKVIERLKPFPEETKQIVGEGAPKTVWDEYKEQIQYEEYDSFEILQDTIDTMAEDSVKDLSSEEIKELYNSIYENYETDDVTEMSIDIKNEILSYLHDEAESEDIAYNAPYIKFVKYQLDINDYPDDDLSENDLIAVAEVLNRVSPSEYLIHSYSKATGPEGEQRIEDLTYLDEDCGLDRITLEKFEEIKKSFFPI